MILSIALDIMDIQASSAKITYDVWTSYTPGSEQHLMAVDSDFKNGGKNVGPKWLKRGPTSFGMPK